ncbi:MAG TPA: ABC transporter permease subunit [Euzebyales bacterium]|nr:ABC transporter permease subunit [Euzebyales bacterium]
MTAAAHAPSPLAGRWTAGFANVFVRESRRWWTTRRWWTQALLWTTVLNGLMLGFLWIAGQAAATGPAVGVREVWPQYVPIAVLLSTVGVVVLTQGVMLDERRSGTLEWVLAKPVSRTAFVLAKLAAHGMPTLFALLVVPWSGLYLLLSAQVDGVWPGAQFLAVAGLVALLLAFTVALTVLLGIATVSRGLVIGAPIAAVMLYDGAHVLARDLAGRLPFPWETTTVAVQLATGAPLASAIPITATLAWTAAAVLAACWRFEREQL